MLRFPFINIGVFALFLLAAASFSQTLDSPYRIETFAGSDPIRDGGPAPDALLAGPTDVAVDAQGGIYIADRVHGLIRKVAPDGMISTVAGSIQGFLTDDGTLATEMFLSSPRAVAIGPGGDLHFSDGTGKVIRIGADGRTQTFAGSGRLGVDGDGGAATETKIGVVSDLAFGPDGSLFLCDSFNNRVRRVSPEGVITTVAGNGERGFGGDGGAAVAASLSSPLAIAVGADGALYIADDGNRRVRKVGADGVIQTILGTGEFGSPADGEQATAARIGVSASVAVGPDGVVYVADQTRIYAIGLDGVINVIANRAGRTSGCADDIASALEACLSRPRGLTIDDAGAIYFAGLDLDLIHKIPTDGSISTVAGKSHYFGDGGPATEAGLYSPEGIAVDAQGNVFIADSENYVVRKV